SRDVVDRTVAPGVAMPADYHYLVGILTPSDDAESVLDSLERPIAPFRPHSHPHPDAGATEVITETQAALPTLRHRRSLEPGKNPRSIAMAHRHDGDPGDAHRVDGQSARTGHRRPARGARVAVAVEDRAALHSVLVAHRTRGVHLPDRVAVVTWVAVDDQGSRTVQLCFACLDAAIGAPVPGDGDLAQDADPQRVKGAIVSGQT